MRWYVRLRRSGEIAHVRRRGVVSNHASLVMYAVAARDGQTRIAISVSKAVGTAVVRNLIRRRVRGALDSRPALLRGQRVLIVAKPGARIASFASLERDVMAALGRLARPV